MPLKAEQIATDALTAAQLAPNAVGASELATGAVAAAGDIAADIVGNLFEEVPAACEITTLTNQKICDLALSFTPAGNSSVTLLVNGLGDYKVGDGVDTAEFYWSADGGTTPKALAAIAAGDKPYTGDVVTALHALTGADRATYIYSKSVS